jgi:hypothetical protein
MNAGSRVIAIAIFSDGAAPMIHLFEESSWDD